MKKLTLIVASLLVLGGGIVQMQKVFAEETATEKVQNEAGDAKTKAKKHYRAAKRHARKKMGTDNVMKDANDKAKDVGDDVSNEAEKAKRKAD